MEWVVAYRASDVGVNGDRESLLGLFGERLNDDSAETRLVGVAADAVDEADVTGVGLGLVRVRVVGDETTPEGRVEELQDSPLLVGSLRRAGAAHSARVAWQGFRGGTADGARDLDHGHAHSPRLYPINHAASGSRTMPRHRETLSSVALPTATLGHRNG